MGKDVFCSQLGKNQNILRGFTWENQKQFNLKTQCKWSLKYLVLI